MDGVLLDTESVSFECWKRAAFDFKIEGIESVYKKCVGMNLSDIKSLLSDYYGNKIDSEKFYAATGDYFHIIEKEKGLSLMPGVKSCLESLKSAGVTMAVASSTRSENVMRQLTNAGIISYFKTITTGDLVSHSKPDPEIYLLSASSLGVRPENCIAVEDSPNGVRSAHTAGMKCVMVPDQIQPTAEIKSLAWKVCASLTEIPPLVLQ